MTKTFRDSCGKEFEHSGMLEKRYAGAVRRTFSDPMSDLQVMVAISRPNGQSLEDLCVRCTLDILHRLDKRYKSEVAL